MIIDQKKVKVFSSIFENICDYRIFDLHIFCGTDSKPHEIGRMIW